MEREPKTLQEAIVYFSNPDRCFMFLMARRFSHGAYCPVCDAKDVRFIATRKIWECKNKHPKRQFSIKIGTIFEESPIGLDKWLTAVWMIANCKNGISSYEIHRALGVTQKTAWFMLHRVRLALRTGTFDKMGGDPDSGVEVDETFVGGRVKNMHSRKRNKLMKESGDPNATKTIVMGILDRSQRQIRTFIVPNTSRTTLQAQVLKNVRYGTRVFSDESRAYSALADKYVHEFVNHMETYVRGQVHTNGLENFWSLFKRHLAGTYVAVEPCHMHRYLDEQVFRYNNRGTKEQPKNDADRFDLVLRNLVGKRITYKELTGKEGASEAF
ncbi:MAG: IS1595 family transposase [Candidatus Sulfotelmatobacter sp.]